MNKVYIDIDSLLDTRYPIVKRFVVDKDYITRINDNHKYIGFKGFRLLYNFRNVKTLVQSKLTPMYEEVLGMYIYKRKELLAENIDINVEVDINIYPYIVDDTIKDMLLKKLEMILVNVKLNIINKKPDFWIMSDYYGAIMYDGLLMLDKMVVNRRLLDSPKPNMIFMTSVNIDSGVTKCEEFTDTIKSRYQPYVSLQLIPFKYFCSKELIAQTNEK